MKVLVVDDDAIIAMDIANFIVTDLGHEAVTASSGNEAIELIKRANEFEFEFDIVITDTRMENGDGIDVLEFLYDTIDELGRPLTYLHSSDSAYCKTGRESSLRLKFLSATVVQSSNQKVP